jgi:hypothetical protein
MVDVRAIWTLWGREKSLSGEESDPDFLDNHFLVQLLYWRNVLVSHQSQFHTYQSSTLHFILFILNLTTLLLVPIAWYRMQNDESVVSWLEMFQRSKKEKPSSRLSVSKRRWRRSIDWQSVAAAQNHCVSGVRSPSEIINTRKHNVSETWPASIL